MNANSKITSLKERLLYLDKTDDKHFIDKIVELYEEGVDEQTLQSIFWQRYEIEDWLRDKSLEGKDYTVLYKENEKGIFRSTTYKTEDVKQVWLSTLVAEDEDVTINMPTSFEEAHLLGMVGWCFCDNRGYWIQHTNPTSQDGYGETIYFIHNVLQENPDDYATDMVKRGGNHEILNRKHHHLNVSQYLRSVGDLARILVPATREITESKTNNDMKKNVVKINENTLRQIVAESVKKVLKEGEFDNNYKACLQHISAALEAIKEVWKGEDNGYDANSEYTRKYNDMLGQLHNHLRDAFFVAKELAANGRDGDFDASGYHSAGF